MGQLDQEGIFVDETILEDNQVNKEITDGVDNVIRRKGKNALTRTVPILGIPLIIAYIYFNNAL